MPEVDPVSVVSELGGGATECTYHTHLRVYRGGLHLCASLGTAAAGGRIEGVVPATAVVGGVPPMLLGWRVCVSWRRRHLVGWGR